MKDVEIGYSYQVQQALMHAMEAAEDCCNASIGTEHLLIGILKIKEAKLTELLRKEGVTDQTIAQEVQILFGFDTSSAKAGVYTSALNAILQDAQRKAQHRKESEVSIDEVSASLLERENNVALELLRRSGIVIEQLIEELNHTELFQDCPELRSLNHLAQKRRGKTALREKEIESMIHVLMRMEKSNCVLTGPAGVGKSAVVEELAARIEKGQVPEDLRGMVVAELNVNAMVAGTKYRGEFEKKIQHLLDMLKKEHHVILFIDEMHLIVGAGKAEGSLDIASVLKPVLARGDIKVIGATTDEEYERWIMKDKALQRRFVRIEITEPDEQMTLAMLKEKGKDLSSYHQVKFQRGLLKECIRVSGLIFPHLKYPDKAIDLLDMSCAAAKCRQLKLVTMDCLKEAVSQVSEVPVSAAELTKDLNQELSMSIQNTIRQSMKQLIERKEAVLWHVEGTKTSHLKDWCQNRLNAEIHEIHASLFDSFSTSDVIRWFEKQLAANRIHVFWVNHAEMLRKDVMNLITSSNFESLAQLYESSCSLKGCLVVLSHAFSSSIGFLPEKGNDEVLRIDAIQIDESQPLVVS